VRPQALEKIADPNKASEDVVGKLFSGFFKDYASKVSASKGDVAIPAEVLEAANAEILVRALHVLPRHLARRLVQTVTLTPRVFLGPEEAVGQQRHHPRGLPQVIRPGLSPAQAPCAGRLSSLRILRQYIAATLK
jgi:hypothetical protein